MALDELSPDLADFARALVDAAGLAGLQPRVTSTVRTRSQQARLYRGYLANPQRAYPVAPPGYSAHEYGEAFDLVVTPMEALADVGYTWQQWGGGWNPADAVHFELPGASERAKQRGAQEENKSPFLVELASSIPFGISFSIILDFLGIPTSARKNITPRQEQYLRTLAQQAGLK
jgi:hypothetical protein